ncbi:flagellar basal body rod protein FlgB [Paracidovorax anthurii]|uniref:Flagellar basal body rod protein FlgB n=1 Tax=Paracidovorax anthurii TaxID=78229 RepID=A0A328YQI0_9BURK|nr:flagellar basal body protein [Paracidovorax anthurii]RAR75910.1 flagellar basal-body rod protein FlgB [Paracidovorax anthurii]
MTEGIEAITQASLALALDAASLRHQAIAHNIANAGTEGFVPMKLSFSAQMDEARRQLAQGHRLSESQITALSQEGFRLEPALTSAGVPLGVQLDSEVAQMAQNAVHYQALLKGLSRHMAILSSAVSDGKR